MLPPPVWLGPPVKPGPCRWTVAAGFLSHICMDDPTPMPELREIQALEDMIRENQLLVDSRHMLRTSLRPAVQTECRPSIILRPSPYHILANCAPGTSEGPVSLPSGVVPGLSLDKDFMGVDARGFMWRPAEMTLWGDTLKEAFDFHKSRRCRAPCVSIESLQPAAGYREKVFTGKHSAASAEQAMRRTRMVAMGGSVTKRKTVVTVTKRPNEAWACALKQVRDSISWGDMNRILLLEPIAATDLEKPFGRLPQVFMSDISYDPIKLPLVNEVTVVGVGNDGNGTAYVTESLPETNASSIGPTLCQSNVSRAISTMILKSCIGCSRRQKKGQVSCGPRTIVMSLNNCSRMDLIIRDCVRKRDDCSHLMVLDWFDSTVDRERFIAAQVRNYTVSCSHFAALPTEADILRIAASAVAHLQLRRFDECTVWQMMTLEVGLSKLFAQLLRHEGDIIEAEHFPYAKLLTAALTFNGVFINHDELAEASSTAASGHDDMKIVNFTPAGFVAIGTKPAPSEVKMGGLLKLLRRSGAVVSPISPLSLYEINAIINLLVAQTATEFSEVLPRSSLMISNLLRDSSQLDRIQAAEVSWPRGIRDNDLESSVSSPIRSPVREAVKEFIWKEPELNTVEELPHAVTDGLSKIGPAWVREPEMRDDCSTAQIVEYLGCKREYIRVDKPTNSPNVIIPPGLAPPLAGMGLVTREGWSQIVSALSVDVEELFATLRYRFLDEVIRELVGPQFTTRRLWVADLLQPSYTRGSFKVDGRVHRLLYAGTLGCVHSALVTPLRDRSFPTGFCLFQAKIHLDRTKRCSGVAESQKVVAHSALVASQKMEVRGNHNVGLRFLASAMKTGDELGVKLTDRMRNHVRQIAKAPFTTFQRRSLLSETEMVNECVVKEYRMPPGNESVLQVMIVCHLRAWASSLRYRGDKGMLNHMMPSALLKEGPDLEFIGAVLQAFREPIAKTDAPVVLQALIENFSKGYLKSKRLEMRSSAFGGGRSNAIAVIPSLGLALFDASEDSPTENKKRFGAYEVIWMHGNKTYNRFRSVDLDYCMLSVSEPMPISSRPMIHRAAILSRYGVAPFINFWSFSNSSTELPAYRQNEFNVERNAVMGELIGFDFDHNVLPQKLNMACAGNGRKPLPGVDFPAETYWLLAVFETVSPMLLNVLLDENSVTARTSPILTRILPNSPSPLGLQKHEIAATLRIVGLEVRALLLRNGVTSILGPTVPVLGIESWKNSAARLVSAYLQNPKAKKTRPDSIVAMELLDLEARGIGLGRMSGCFTSGPFGQKFNPNCLRFRHHASTVSAETRSLSAHLSMGPRGSFSTDQMSKRKASEDPKIVNARFPGLIQRGQVKVVRPKAHSKEMYPWEERDSLDALGYSGVMENKELDVWSKTTALSVHLWLERVTGRPVVSGAKEVFYQGLQEIICKVLRWATTHREYNMTTCGFYDLVDNSNYSQNAKTTESGRV